MSRGGLERLQQVKNLALLPLVDLKECAVDEGEQAGDAARPVADPGLREQFLEFRHVQIRRHVG